MTKKDELVAFFQANAHRGFIAREIHVKFPNYANYYKTLRQLARDGVLSTWGERGGKEYRWRENQ